jgi:hypothetical protein
VSDLVIKVEDCDLSKICEEGNTSFVQYSGSISMVGYQKLISVLSRAKQNQRKRVILNLVTYGGDASAAYRIARLLQQTFGRVELILTSQCKSAGTLIALGANKLWMTVLGELGPLDVQLVKKDEVFSRQSGLVTESALDVLMEKAFTNYETMFLGIKARSQDSISFKLASDVARELSSAIIGGIAKGIDPLVLGENQRDLEVAVAYGNRLASISRNAKEKTLEQLVRGYPSHDFVIDLDEAKELFVDVALATTDMFKLWGALGIPAISPTQGEPDIKLICNPEIVNLSSSKIRGQRNGSEARNNEIKRQKPKGVTATTVSRRLVRREAK